MADLLEALFVAELIAPPSELLIVSPWISDFPAIDNRCGQYAQLDADWPASRVRFSAVLRSLLTRGSTIKLACRPGQREDEFVDRLESAASADGTRGNLVLQRHDPKLRDHGHEKAMVAQSWAIQGSMNVTFSGVEINGELVTMTTEEDAIAALRTELRTLFEAPYE